MIFEETPALAIDPAGVRKRLTTPSGRVRAAHIALCGNADLTPLVPGLAETVVPITGYVAVTAPLGERLAEAVTYRGAISDTRLANYHYRIIDGDRLMWAGDGGLWPRWPAPEPAKPLPAPRSRGSFRSLGPDRDRACVVGRHGVLGASACRRSARSFPGSWLASGFGGHGLNTSAMAGGVDRARDHGAGRSLAALFAP